MEVITTAIAVSAWELIGKPFAEKARDYYSEKVLDSIPNLWDKFTSLNDNDKKAIEAVIIDMPEDVRKDKEKFKEHIVKSLTINNQQRIVQSKTYIETLNNPGGTINFN